MHELSVAQALLDQVTQQAAAHRAEKVTRIVLHIGPLAGVVPELLETAFPLAAAGTLAESAELVTQALPVRVKCEKCQAETDATANNLTCAACGDWHTQLVSGDELILASIEMLGEDVHA